MRPSFIETRDRHETEKKPRFTIPRRLDLKKEFSKVKKVRRGELFFWLSKFAVHDWF